MPKNLQWKQDQVQLNPQGGTGSTKYYQMRKFTMSTILTVSNEVGVYCHRHAHYIHYVYDVPNFHNYSKLGTTYSAYSGHGIKSPKRNFKVNFFHLYETPFTPLCYPTPLVPRIKDEWLVGLRGSQLFQRISHYYSAKYAKGYINKSVIIIFPNMPL